jgi:gluconate 5-dehydrogenase
MSSDMFSLHGRTALVTGSTQGLGFGIAQALSRAGAIVAINGRSSARVEDTVKELVSAGFNARPCPFDVTDRKAMDEAITAFELNNSPIDILFNNSAVQIRGSLDNYREDDWRSLMGLNLDAVFFTAQRVARGMRDRGRGKIINMLSLSAVTGRTDVGPYAASKAAVMSLTRSMALEWGRFNIQINGIGPGWFMTKMIQPAIDRNPQLDTWLKFRTPAGRWGDPKTDLNGVAVFLSSSASDFVNGQVIFVDGGHLTSTGM